MATTESIAPKQLSRYKVFITSLNGIQLDITPHVIETSIFESIYSINMHGQLVIADNAAILSDLPLVGQEKIKIEFSRGEVDVDIDFVVSGIENVESLNSAVGTYTILFTSESKLINAVSEFSRTYKGLGIDIIEEIYNDNFGKDSLNVKTGGGPAVNIVMPFTKPFAAINMIQRNTYDSNNSPVFIFDTVYDDAPQLTSMYTMFNQESVHKITNRLNTNTEVDGESSRDMLDHVGEAYDIKIPSAYNVFNQIAEGAFAADIDTVDISTKSINRFTFDYTKQEDIRKNEYMHSNYLINSTNISAHTNSYRITNYTNVKAFDSLDNLYGRDNYAKSIVNSRLRRLDTIKMYLHMDSVTTIAAGKIIDVDFMRFTPMLSNSDEPKDAINSGKYLIASLRHHIKLGEYTMSLNLIRNTVGDA